MDGARGRYNRRGLLPHEAEEDKRLVTAQRRGKMSPEMLAQLGAATADLAAHLADPTDAHDASAVSFAAFGTITSADVQAAIQELDGEYKATDTILAAAIAAHTGDTDDAHDASAISFAPAGTIAATTVQAAIEEVAAEAGGGISALVDATDYPLTTVGDIFVGARGAGTNYATPGHGASATAISSFAGTSPADLIDGSNATDWTSNTTVSASPWFKIDLGTARPILNVLLYQATSAQRALTVLVESSPDDSTWTTRLSSGTLTSPDSGMLALSSPATARYWRFTLLTYPGSGLLFWEVYAAELWSGAGGAAVEGAPERLLAGADGHALFADSAQALGLVYRPVATGDVGGLAEFVRDTMGAALVAGTSMTVTVNDGADTITLDSSGGAALTVEELDGSPTDSAVTKIVFPNGTLGIVGHVATYTPTGGGGGTHRAARVYNTATQSIANITWTSLTFNSERQDDATFHSTVSNTSRLTAQTTGWHLLWANVRLDAANNGKGSRFYLNNATEIAVDFTSGDGAGTRILPPLSCLYYLTAGDYVEYQVYHTNGSSFSTTVEANAAPEFGIVELF